MNLEIWLGVRIFTKFARRFSLTKIVHPINEFTKYTVSAVIVIHVIMVSTWGKSGLLGWKLSWQDNSTYDFYEATRVNTL